MLSAGAVFCLWVATQLTAAFAVVEVRIIPELKETLFAADIRNIAHSQGSSLIEIASCHLSFYAGFLSGYI